MAQEIEERLKKLYYDSDNSAGVSGIDSIYREVNKRKNAGRLTRKEIINWLKAQDTYTLHKPIRRRFKRNRVIVSGIDSLWQADLADFSSFSEFNDGFKWLLVVIDVFSKYLWCRPLKNKSASEIVRAFREILSEGRKPKKIKTDQGTEFLNAKLKKLFREHDITAYTTFQDVKASVVERVIRTLKTRLWRYFSWKSSYRYIDQLQNLVNSCNHAKHRSIGRAPSDVSKSNEWFVWRKLYADAKPPRKRTKTHRFEFEVGQKVGISKAKKIFDKGFERNWSPEIFVVSERLPRTPPVYRVKDLANQLIEGAFYRAELQAITKEEDKYPVEKILRKKKVRRKFEYLVKWKGYPWELQFVGKSKGLEVHITGSRFIDHLIHARSSEKKG